MVKVEYVERNLRAVPEGALLGQVGWVGEFATDGLRGLCRLELAERDLERGGFLCSWHLGVGCLIESVLFLLDDDVLTMMDLYQPYIPLDALLIDEYLDERRSLLDCVEVLNSTNRFTFIMM